MDTNIDKLMGAVRKAAVDRTLAVRDYRARGLTFAEIAKILGISRQRVKQICDRKGA
jgi:DNA-directed RNA polymerase sigma subunit (sigma70/sigma32)